MSEQVLEKALQKFLEAQKDESPKMHRGKQTLKAACRAETPGLLPHVEWSATGTSRPLPMWRRNTMWISALKKDTTAEQPRYLVFFKSRDADAITAAFQEFASRKMGRDEEKPSIRERLAQAREQAAQKVEHRSAY